MSVLKNLGGRRSLSAKKSSPQAKIFFFGFFSTTTPLFKKVSTGKVAQAQALHCSIHSRNKILRIGKVRPCARWGVFSTHASARAGAASPLGHQKKKAKKNAGTPATKVANVPACSTHAQAHGRLGRPRPRKKQKKRFFEYSRKKNRKKDKKNF